MKLFFLVLNAILLFFCLNSCLQDTNEFDEFSINKNWKFAIGDSIVYAQPNFNDESWLVINEVKNFSACGYKDYDGYAWYRCKFHLPKKWQMNSAIKKFDLLIGQIDDCDQVYLNGHLLGSNGNSGDSSFKTASSSYNVTRNYEVESKFLNFTKPNVLAIRVLDQGREGGISSNIFIKPSRFRTSKQYDLKFKWWFNNSDSLIYLSKNFDHSKWAEIRTGEYWESQGFGGYDGYAWYRSNFKFPASFQQEIKDKYAKLQLVLGKVDDLDQVYINGHLIGENGKDVSFGGKGSPLFSSAKTLAGMDRVYTIQEPDKVMAFSSENTIAIRVFDSGGDGGILGKAIINLKFIESDIRLDVTKLYQVNEQNLLDTFAVIHNNDPIKKFKGKFIYNIYSKQMAKNNKRELSLKIKPKSSVIIPVSIPTSKEDVDIHIRIEDEFSTNILYQHIKLPFVLYK